MYEKKISIIIPTYNHLEDLLKPCVDSLIKMTTLDETIEVIVSANGCKDGTREYIEGLNTDSFKLLWSDEPLGFTRATNEAIRIATGDYIILLNNDTVFLDWEKDLWLKMLLEPLENDPLIGITGPLKNHCPATNRDFLIFFLVAIRRELFDKVGLLNEIFNPGGGEDTDFAIKIQNLGYKIVEVPTEYTYKGISQTYTGYPIYHKAEGTMHSNDVEWTKIAPENNWDDIFKRNTSKLKEIWNPDFDVLAIFPTYNEIEFIEDKINWCRKNGLTIYVIDNYSSDGTWEYLLKSGVRCHRFDTEDSFDILKLQENITQTVKFLKPSWVMYLGGDLFVSHKENKKLIDVITEYDKEGYTSIKIPVYTFHNTGEKFNKNYYETYNYVGERDDLRLIFKYTEDFYIKGDHVFMKYENIKETDDMVLFNYGFSRKLEHQDEKYKRRELAWKKGLNREIGRHFKDGYERRWIWKIEELNNIKNTVFEIHQKNLIDFFSKKEELVQIIVPTYKRYRGLENTLSHILKQTYSKIKVWVCSDGEDIEVERIVNRMNFLSDTIDIVYEPLKEHGGNHGGPARRYIMDIMHNEGFVCFVDDDNIIYDNYVEELVGAFKEDVGITYCNIWINNVHVPQEIIIPNFDQHNKFIEGKIDSLNFMVRASLAKKYKDSWTDNYTHDFNFITAISKETKSVYVPKILGNHIYKKEDKIHDKNEETISAYTDEILKSYDSANNKYEGVWGEIVEKNGYSLTKEMLKGKRVLDIGAHYGNFTALAITLGASSVIAVEPVPGNLEKLRKTIDRYPKTKLIEKAIGRKDQTHIYISEEQHNSKQTSEDKGTIVETTTLKEILKEFPIDDNDLFLKIDCEGCEYNFIKDSDIEDLRRFSIIRAEFHDMDWVDGTMDSLNTYMIEKAGFLLEDKQQMYFYPYDTTISVYELPARNYYYKRNDDFLTKDYQEKMITELYDMEKNDDIELKKQDPEIYDEIFTNNTYGVNRDEIINCNVLDIGSYFGFFSILAHRYEAKEIISIEANPYHMGMLNKNIKEYDNIVALNYAITKPGQKSVFIKNKGTSSFISETDGIEIPAKDLQYVLDLFKDKTLDNILKLDTEGSEYEIVLNSNPETIKKFKYIYLELHSFDRIKNDPNSFIEYVKNLGFSLELDMQGVIFDSEGNVTENLPVRMIKFKNNDMTRNVKKDSSIKITDFTNMEKKITNDSLPDGWFSDHDISIYRSFIERLPDTATFCEIGTYEGRSLCSVADIILKKNLIPMVIDTFVGSSNIYLRKEGVMPETEKRFRKNIEKFGIKDRTIIYPERSGDAHVRVQNNYLHLLFIDGDHYYDGVEADILNWFDKVRVGGFIIGHDGLWNEVERAVKNNLYDVKFEGNMWFMCKTGKAEKLKPYVTAVISTRNRYFQTLPLAIVAIANQTYTPKQLLIYDDGEHRDLREEPLYKNIFNLLYKKGIKWGVTFGNGIGQVVNHDRSIHDAAGEWIWRIDDDNIPESNVLETLVNNIETDVGAVAGLVLDPKGSIDPNQNSSNEITKIFEGLNIQWFNHPWKSEVDHLYSSFIYRVEAAGHGYEKSLSRVGFREETIFTYEMKRKGWRLIVDPSVTTWHFHHETGGIRDNTKEELWHHDENIFLKKMDEWKILPIERKLIVLDNGIGDHIVFKKLITRLKEKYSDKNITLAVCYNEVFEDVSEGINIISIETARKLTNIDPLNVYRWMQDCNWKGNIEDAYIKMYEL